MRLKEYEIAILFPWGAQHYYRKKIVNFYLDIHIHGILCVCIWIAQAGYFCTMVIYTQS